MEEGARKQTMENHKRATRYQFQRRDYNILTGVQWNRPDRLPKILDAKTTNMDHRKTESLNLKNTNSVTYDPISKVSQATLSYPQAIKNYSKRKKYLMTDNYQKSHLFSSKYREDYQTDQHFSKKRGLYHEYYGESTNNFYKVFKKYRA